MFFFCFTSLAVLFSYFVFYCCLCARERQPTTTANLHTYKYIRIYVWKNFTSWVKLQTTHCSFHSVYFNWTTITDLVVSCCCCGCSCVWLFFLFIHFCSRSHSHARTHITHIVQKNSVFFCSFVASFEKYGDSLESKEHSQCTHIKIYISIVSYHFVSFVRSGHCHTLLCFVVVAVSLSSLS